MCKNMILLYFFQAKSICIKQIFDQISDQKLKFISEPWTGEFCCRIMSISNPSNRFCITSRMLVRWDPMGLFPSRRAFSLLRLMSILGIMFMIKTTVIKQESFFQECATASLPFHYPSLPLHYFLKPVTSLHSSKSAPQSCLAATSVLHK